MDYTTEAILDGIGTSNNDVLNYVYSKFFPDTCRFVENNSGTNEDARDLFQEAIIVIFRKMKKAPIVLTCNFRTYIYSVCRLLWLKKLEKQKDDLDIIKSEAVLDQQVEDVSKSYEQTEKYRLYQKHFLQLPPDCQEILKLYLEKVSAKEIAKKLGFAGEDYVKSRKYKCKQTLIMNIKSDNQFTEV
jgi:RNA polymerase sigma factor (sigma-70 family)